MHTRSVTVTAAFVAAASFAAPHTHAGDETPLFVWANPVDGNWSTAANWSPVGVPGFGAFAVADVLFNAPSQSPYTASITNISPILRNLTLEGLARLSFNSPITVEGDFRMLDATRVAGVASGVSELLVDGDAFFGDGAEFSGNISLLRVIGLFENHSVAFGVNRLQLNPNNTGATRDINHGFAIVGAIEAGFFENAGTLRTTVNSVQIRDFLNTGETRIHGSAFPLGTFTVEEEFTNRGLVTSTHLTTMFRADTFIHEGIFETTNSDGILEFTGNHRFNTPDPFRAIRVDIFGNPDEPLILEGTLDTTTPIAFFGDSIATDATLRLRGASFFMENNVDFHAEVSANGLFVGGDSVLFAESVHTTARLTIQASGHVDFLGDITVGGETTLRAESIHSSGNNSVTGLLTLLEADALFDHAFVVDGSLVLQQGAAMRFADGSAIRATGNVTWNNPGETLDTPIVAGGQAIIGAQRIAATVDANFIRLGGGTMELAADITADTLVVIAGTTLSLGARGEFTHATIDADLSTTYALSQSWLLDVGIDESRGVAASDLLTVTGALDLYGVLIVDLVGDPASLRPGDEFTLITAASISGAFRGFSLPTLTGTLSWDYFQTDTALGLRVVPAPGALAFLALLAFPRGRR